MAGGGLLGSPPCRLENTASAAEGQTLGPGQGARAVDRPAGPARDDDVPPEAPDLRLLELAGQTARGPGLREGGEAAEEEGGYRDDDAVDEPRAEEGDEDSRPALDHEAAEAPGAEFAEEDLEVEETVGSPRQREDLRAGGLEGAASLRGRLRGADEEEGARGMGEESGPGGAAETGVEDEGAGAPPFDEADGEGGIVREDGADADEDGLVLGAETVGHPEGLGAAQRRPSARGGGDAAVEALGPGEGDRGSAQRGSM